MAVTPPRQQTTTLVCELTGESLDDLHAQAKAAIQRFTSKPYTYTIDAEQYRASMNHYRYKAHIGALVDG